MLRVGLCNIGFKVGIDISMVIQILPNIKFIVFNAFVIVLNSILCYQAQIWDFEIYSPKNGYGKC